MPDLIKVVIVEDEEKSLNLISNLLKQIPEVKLKNAFTDPVLALENILRNPPDLIVLDIHMPKLSGLELIDLLKKHEVYIPFLFITAHDEYMIDALRKSAIDYLLKPVSLEDLKNSIKRFLNNFENNPRRFAHREFEKLDNELLRINSKTGFEVVKTSEIICFQAEGRYTKIIAEGNREIIVSKNIGSFENLIKPKNLLRIHRSTIINPVCFQKINRITRICHLKYGKYEYKVKASSEGIKVLDNYFSGI